MFAALEEPANTLAPPSSQDSVLLHLRRRAMATGFEIVLPFGTPNAVALGETAFDLLDTLEQQLTVYRETSEVSRLNQRLYEAGACGGRLVRLAGTGRSHSSRNGRRV